VTFTLVTDHGVRRILLASELSHSKAERNDYEDSTSKVRAVSHFSVPIFATLSFILYISFNPPRWRLKYTVSSDGQASIFLLHTPTGSNHFRRLCYSLRKEDGKKLGFRTRGKPTNINWMCKWQLTFVGKALAKTVGYLWVVSFLSFSLRYMASYGFQFELGAVQNPLVWSIADRLL
jgi:hypothetical protein